ncbi:MAG: RHS repeat-associated core domain-containing protein, partial [Phycisphaerales bacterium]|nr:RHS repeat-associated core domain-containing protein [Phycisphaerales bacterium]
DTDVDPENLDWPTRNNRLLKYEIRKDSTSGDLLRTVSYTYYKTGHASNITVKDWYVDSSTTPGNAADYDWYHDLALYYFTNGSLRLAMNDKWKLDGQGAPTNYTSLTAREFRYDGIGIARYLAVDYNTNNEPTDPSQWTLVGSPMLTDYAGSTPLTDSSIGYSSSYSATADTRYFAGDGRETLGSGGSVTDLRYFHGDLVDSRVLATDDSAAAVATTAYTAFGEAVVPLGSPARPFTPTTLGSRYQYAGRFGYEAEMLGVGGPNSNLSAVALSHVGARWYQSDIGRFVQRDPIGLSGGTNLYAYCADNPLMRVDPTGHGFWDGENGFHDWIARHFWMNIHDQATLAGMSEGRATAEAVGLSVGLGVGGWLGVRYCISLLRPPPPGGGLPIPNPLPKWGGNYYPTKWNGGGTVDWGPAGPYGFPIGVF